LVLKELKMADKSKPGLWANIHAKKERGEAPAKPGDKGYPDAKNWKKVTSISEKKGTAAWQKAEGKNPEGGLNEKGRASLKAQGHDIKRPQPEGGSRKDSFCARMKGMKSKLTSSETANDPDSRINKSLRKWKCGSAYNQGVSIMANTESGFNNANHVLRAFNKSAAISDIMSAYGSLDPRVQNAIKGSIVGAGLGGIGNLALGSKRKSGLRRLLGGALGGGALGAGVGSLAKYLQMLQEAKSEAADGSSSLEPYAPEFNRPNPVTGRIPGSTIRRNFRGHIVDPYLQHIDPYRLSPPQLKDSPKIKMPYDHADPTFGESAFNPKATEEV
jgi:hypothetical protein